MCVLSVLHDLWYEGSGGEADTAQGEAECCISIKTIPQVP